MCRESCSQRADGNARSVIHSALRKGRNRWKAAVAASLPGDASGNGVIVPSEEFGADGARTRDRIRVAILY
jgi:hypothetical protein